VIARHSKGKAMSTRVLVIAILAPALMLSACGGTQNRGLESVHQPVVQRTDFVFDAAIDDGHLSSGELQRVAGWMASLNLTYGDKVAVDDPTGNAGTARSEIASLVDRYGMSLAEQTPITASTIAPGTVRLIISRMTASVPGCPDHSRPGNHEFNANTSSDFGCAMNANLAAMVARPEDLVRGKPGIVTSDPAVSNKATLLLRKTPPTGAGGLKSAGTGGK